MKQIIITVHNAHLAIEAHDERGRLMIAGTANEVYAHLARLNCKISVLIKIVD